MILFLQYNVFAVTRFVPSGYPPMMAPIGYGYPYFAPGMPYPQYWVSDF